MHPWRNYQGIVKGDLPTCLPAWWLGWHEGVFAFNGEPCAAIGLS
jgi:hypothetical protein